MNDLLPYKLDGMEIERWAKTILLDRENTRVGEIEFLIKCFRNESLMWDRAKGIQNIFLGLKKIEYSNGEYKLLRDIW